MNITIDIDFVEGLSVQEQSETFQVWFDENILPQIDFADTCSKHDDFNRPLEWVFADIKVQAIYFTVDEAPELAMNPNYRYNLNFKTFMIYGNI